MDGMPECDVKSTRRAVMYMLKECHPMPENTIFAKTKSSSSDKVYEKVLYASGALHDFYGYATEKLECVHTLYLAYRLFDRICDSKAMVITATNCKGLMLSCITLADMYLDDVTDVETKSYAERHFLNTRDVDQMIQRTMQLLGHVVIPLADYEDFHEACHAFVEDFLTHSDEEDEQPMDITTT